MTNPQIQRIALVLQVAGFLPSLGIVAVWHPLWAILFELCFTVHLVGDVLFYLANRSQGEKSMPFDINKFVKLPAFLQFVGMFLAIILVVVLYFVHASGFWAATFAVLTLLAVGVAFAGFLYDKIYQ